MKDDRGELDLTKQIQDLNSQNEGLKNLINFQKQEIWELKKIKFENEQNKNLVSNFKKLIEEISKNVR